jgi:hypothetical protein
MEMAMKTKKRASYQIQEGQHITTLHQKPHITPMYLFGIDCITHLPMTTTGHDSSVVFVDRLS